MCVCVREVKEAKYIKGRNIREGRRKEKEERKIYRRREMRKIYMKERYI